MNASTSDTAQNAEAATRPRRPWAMRLLGWRSRPGKLVRFVPTVWGWFLMASIVMLVSAVGFAEYTMEPEFCRSCHIMEPYFQAWHDSTHKDVPCGDCHFEPGWRGTLHGKWQASSQAVKYITNTYGSKPHAEVRDVSCLRSDCHAERLLEGDTEWPTQTQRGHDITIRFNHTPHLGEMRRGKELRCVSCHSQMVQGKHIVVTTDTCFLCHFKGLKHGRDEEALGGCTSCHTSPKKSIRLATGEFNHGEYVDRGVECWNCHGDAIAGDGAVPRQQCWNCHNQPQHLARYDDTKFMHQNHVTDHKVECTSCHVQIIHHLSAKVPEGLPSAAPEAHELVDNGSCGQCHTAAHNGPKLLYSGRGGRGVPDMPSPMFRTQVDCVGCHQTKKRDGQVAEVVGQTFTAGQTSCDHCHGSKYDDELEMWHAVVGDLLHQAKQGADNANGMMDQLEIDAVKRLELQRLIDDAEHNIRLVELGHGVHNVIYSTALLNVAKENCRQVVQALTEQADEGTSP